MKTTKAKTTSKTIMKSTKTEMKMREKLMKFLEILGWILPMIEKIVNLFKKEEKSPLKKPTEEE